MNRICQLFGIQYPIIQGGMIWCSGWRLASAVSNGGGLGLIGAGSMDPETLEEHVIKCKAFTDKPFGVNIPLLYPHAEAHFQTVIKYGVKIVFTSAGNPAKYTGFLKEHGITVVHVIPNVKSALKCAESGVDAIVAEGFEAGGHNGKEESTTMTLIPLILRATTLPLIAAGGIGSGNAMLAAFALGAEGVQIGSLFAAAEESSAHPAFKTKIIEAGDGDTFLSLKKVVPVRLLKNKFAEIIRSSEDAGASAEELKNLLGRGRAKKGMFEGDLEDGELEIGQVAAQINEILPAAHILENIIRDFNRQKQELLSLNFE